jgi:WD40 repeat protein
MLRGHTNPVNSVAFSSDGQYISSGSSDTTVRLWTVPSPAEYTDTDITTPSLKDTGKVSRKRTDTHKPKTTFRGHTDWVYSTAFSPSSHLLASCGDCTVRLWDVAAGTAVCTLLGHSAVVRSVAFSPDGQQLASCGYDWSVRLWDINNSSSGSGSSDSRTAVAVAVAVLYGHTAPVFAVAFHPTTGCKQLASCGGDKTVRVWDASTGEVSAFTKNMNNAFRQVFGRATKLL